MKSKLMLVMIAFFMTKIAIAQNQLAQSTQVEIGVGFVQPNFLKGTELIRSYNLRQNGLSYYADNNGNRNAVGKYSSSTGYNFNIGFYKPIKKVNGLMLGALVRNAQTGSNPEKGGYSEAYFFNFITAGIAAKYYPFTKNNLFVKADFGLAAVLTKNRFLNATQQQEIFHQFGIGTSFGFETGYAFQIFKDKSKAIELKAGYQLANTRVEVNVIGDDNWQFGAIYFGTSFNF